MPNYMTSLASLLLAFFCMLPKSGLCFEESFFSPLKEAKAKIFNDCKPSLANYVTKDLFTCGDFEGQPSLLVAAIMDDPNYLLPEKNTNIESELNKHILDAIYYATAADSLIFLQAILKSKNITSLSSESWNALTRKYGSHNNPHPITTAVQSGNVGIFFYMLRMGSELSIHDQFGGDLYLHAVTYSKPEMIKILKHLELNVNCDYTSPNGTNLYGISTKYGLGKYFEECR